MYQLRRHYEDSHGLVLKKDSIFYKYLKDIKEKSYRNKGNFFCDQCSAMRTTENELFKHKISKHYSVLKGSGLTNYMALNNKEFDLSIRNLNFMEEIKLVIDSQTSPSSFGWKDPKLIDLFLEESIPLINNALAKISTSRNRALKFFIKFSITNVQKVGNQQIFSLPKFFSTTVLNGLHYSEIIRNILLQNVQKRLLISDDAGNAFQFYSFNRIELVVLSYKKKVIGEIFGGNKRNLFANDECEEEGTKKS